MSVTTFLPAASAQDVATFGAGLAEAEMPPQRSAECRELRPTLDRLPEFDRRIDLWVVGNAVGVQTDGALWYVVLCASPDIRVLCVTYEGNGIQNDHRVQARGAYSRRDDNHVLLDPCLANIDEEGR
ncbi:hypothetical protein [Bradyrhizobium sp. LHD-71]|uniref:hypothetical protein n=1 Tax=Bradyrhizobium sp. LHD-71 TaxID=3072141 RepID=UPI00280D914A|nr:hypothetical protein [Bradyrhizobium sp. LHD-71]MDQ8729486.1 hypothetical protein [Bradyrhizobium sp. LHD-71]